MKTRVTELLGIEYPVIQGGMAQVADAVDIPVIGAGGAGDGRGVAAMFMLGAEAVQMGTRFIVSDEAAVHEGDVTNGTVMAGQIAGLLKDIRPCREIIISLMEEAEAQIARVSGIFQT